MSEHHLGAPRNSHQLQEPPALRDTVPWSSLESFQQVANASLEGVSL